MIWFSNKELVTALRNEIEYLRRQNRDLQNQVMVLSNKAIEYNQTTVVQNMDNPLPMGYGLLNDIKNMPAETPEEIVERELAEKEAMEIFQH